jgi:hypothetical protein
MGPIRCPETSVQNYYSTLRDMPEQRRTRPNFTFSWVRRTPRPNPRWHDARTMDWSCPSVHLSAYLHACFSLSCFLSGLQSPCCRYGESPLMLVFKWEEYVDTVQFGTQVPTVRRNVVCPSLVYSWTLTLARDVTSPDQSLHSSNSAPNKQRRPRGGVGL